MIISKTPVRISFVGGGTDFPGVYANGGGAVISTTINKYIYVTVNKRFDDQIRVSYSTTELVEHVDALRHELIREAMKLTGVTQGVEITTVADVPGHGTGLGSSSALTVGALNALYAYRGIETTPDRLAHEACEIELGRLRQPIGKQDQYIAAYGGLRHVTFQADGGVVADPIMIPRARCEALEQRLLLFFTGITRDAGSILHEQQRRIPDNLPRLDEMRTLVGELRAQLCGDGPLDAIGELLHRGWILKQGLASGVSSNGIGELYERARAGGAIGGKVTGAGGGGFMLLYVPPACQKELRRLLSPMREIAFRLEPQGSQLVYREP